MVNNSCMTRVQTFVDQLETNFDGAPWHGPSVRRLLHGITSERAHQRVLPEAHTIAELLSHLTAWNEIVERRLGGEQVDVTADMDFPSGGGSWEEQIGRLESAHEKLVARLAATPDERLDQSVAGKDYTVAHMIDGLMHHNTYHSAQIALLKK